MFLLGRLCCLINEPHFLSVFLSSRGLGDLGDLDLVVGEAGEATVNNV